MHRRIFLAAAALLTAASLSAQVFGRPPLSQTKFARLPLGSIRADGWLLEQLQRQSSGLTGHLDEVYPEVMGPSNAWLGGDGDAWERGPYWIDGLLPLAWILDDDSLKAKARTWVEAILRSQQEDGYLGPARDHPFVYGLQRGGSHDRWPKMVALKILRQYYEATQDPRVPECLARYFRYQLAHLSQTPLDHWSSWGKERGADNLEIVYWLYNLTGEPWLLELGELLHGQTTDWASLFREGEFFAQPGSVHTVNLAQGFKAPVVWWHYSNWDADLLSPRRALERIRHSCGLPTGLWAGDEQLQFGDPTRGSELCAAVEMMFSLEEMLRLSGLGEWADHLERIAYNALPTQVSDDYSAKQYYQQVNQVSLTRGNGHFSTPHYGTDTMFGTLNGYPCCLSNMHQGWPKLVRNLWYQSSDGGLAALLYGPSSVTATLPDGTRVSIREDTGYPFSETVSFHFRMDGRKGAEFPLTFRVPAWHKGETLRVRINKEVKELKVTPGIFHIRRKWSSGDVLTLEFQAAVEAETWYGGAWSIVRGPLVYALKMEENWHWKAFEGTDRLFGPGAWEVTSTTPWNYCLMRDSFKPEDCTLQRSSSIASYPWNPENAPLSLLVPARELPGWTRIDSVAYWTEDSDDTGKEVTLELIPYGCTTLRIAEFPTRIVPWDKSLREEAAAGLSAR